MCSSAVSFSQYCFLPHRDVTMDFELLIFVSDGEKVWVYYFLEFKPALMTMPGFCLP